MLIPASRLKTKLDEVVTDPLLSGISVVTKKIGERTYIAYIDSNMAKEDHIKCFPDSPPEMDAYPIPLPMDYQPRTMRSIKVGDFTWNIPIEESDKLEWLPRQQHNVFSLKTPEKEPSSEGQYPTR